MIVLTGNISRPLGRLWFSRAPEDHTMGMLLSPTAWRKADWCPYACDNDVFAHSFIGSNPDPEWWKREGETKWLKMLDRVAKQSEEGNPPMFVLLPDVVGDWKRTLEQAWHYVGEVRDRKLPVALALQDAPLDQVIGCATLLFPEWWFVGGTTAWKWASVERLTQAAHSTFGTKIHVGRASGSKAIRECVRVGVDSCDGSKWQAFADVMMPKLYRALSPEREQLSLFRQSYQGVSI